MRSLFISRLRRSAVGTHCVRFVDSRSSGSFHVDSSDHPWGALAIFFTGA